tara:strand:- start:4899 stop:5909 length:1011 start_codon:yes stop_codon:yes gene_type:complete
MGTKDFKQIKDLRSFSVRKAERDAQAHLDMALETLNKDQTYKYRGLGNRLSPGFVPNFNEAECENVLQGRSTNSWIVLGKDRPQGIASGYGGLGADHCGAIDICVGRLSVLSNNPTQTDKTTSSMSIDGTIDPYLDKGFADNDFKADAARIYISERTRIDENFGIAVGRAGGVPGLSAVGIKADQVRIMAREGIKLVTRPDDTNSKGGNADVVLGIDLIAGNDDSDMQPLVKGKNLKNLLLYMIQDISNLASMIHSLTISTISLEAMLAAHSHTSAAGQTLPSIELGVYAVNSQIKKAMLDIPSHYKKVIENILLEIEFLKPYGAQYINSRSNHTN